MQRKPMRLAEVSTGSTRRAAVLGLIAAQAT
jgi:hypothetical protein